MAGHLDVAPEDLINHASRIDALSEHFDAAESAMDSAARNHEAYGVICLFLPPVLAVRQADESR